MYKKAYTFFRCNQKLTGISYTTSLAKKWYKHTILCRLALRGLTFYSIYNNCMIRTGNWTSQCSKDVPYMHRFCGMKRFYNFYYP